MNNMIGFFTKNNRIVLGSSIFLLMDSSVLNGGLVSAKVKPRLRTKLLIAFGSNPLLRNADRVRRRGSFHPSIIPSSINFLIFLFETGMFSNSNRENSTTFGFLNSKLSKISWYNAFLNSYSLVLNA